MIQPNNVREANEDSRRAPDSQQGSRQTPLDELTIAREYGLDKSMIDGSFVTATVSCKYCQIAALESQSHCIDCYSTRKGSWSIE